MPFYLSEWEDAGIQGRTSMRPVGYDQPGWTAIDIRPDSSRLDGGGLNACLLHVPAPFADPRARFLADDKLESLTTQQKNFLTNKLGLDLSAPNLLRDIVATIMTAPPANGWKAIQPGRLRWEIHLGGELLWEAPRASGGASDNFERANETPLAAPWARSTGGPASANLSATHVVDGGSDSPMYYTAAASTGDQYSQLDASNPSGSTEGGPAVRMAAGTFSNYLFDNFSNTALGEVRLWNSGADSVITTGTLTRVNPLRIEAEGSSIRIYSNAALSQTVTNSTLATGQPGFLIYNGFFDNWSGADLAAPVVSNETILMRRRRSRQTSW